MKKSRKKSVVAVVAFLFFLAGLSVLPARAGGEEAAMLENLRKMRTKQQQEEIVIRETRFVHVDKEKHCTPVQQTRQRIRDAEIASGKTGYENININAGHEEINVADNHGTIDSNVNVQIINQGRERECP